MKPKYFNWQIVYLVIGFIITIQVGAFLSEKVRCLTAQKLGYTETYLIGFGELTFVNPIDQEKLNALASDYDNNRKAYTTSQDWKELEKKTGKEYALIESSGLLFNFLISILGLTAFYLRRNRGFTINYIDYISILLGLFFMKKVCYYTCYYLIMGAIPCINIPIPLIGIDFLTMAKGYIIIGWFALLIVLYSLPSNFRRRIIISGLLGVPIGAIAWVYYTSNYIL